MEFQITKSFLTSEYSIPALSNSNSSSFPQLFSPVLDFKKKNDHENMSIFKKQQQFYSLHERKSNLHHDFNIMSESKYHYQYFHQVTERRRKNAEASARFRERQRNRTIGLQEKCQLLEKKVKELESTDNAKRIYELEKKLEELIENEKVLTLKLKEQEIEVCTSKHVLRIV